MKVDVHDWHTNIFLTPEEMKYLCTPGKGADTCVWLVLGSRGFECSYLDKNSSLVDRWKAGKTVAARDGCDFVKNLDLPKIGWGEHEIKVPGVTNG